MKIDGVGNIVEVGTSNGCSTIRIAATMGPLGGRVVSIEKNAGKHSQTHESPADLGLLPFVDLRLGDATDVVASLPGPLDCVFFGADRVSAPRKLDLRCQSLLLENNGLLSLSGLSAM